jgi:hypothetical protein
MPNAPLRRAQLITPFGTGAMVVVKGGMSLIAGGIDHWYEREDGDTSNIDIDEYRIKEWRLERLLHVDHFRQPPDYRRPRKGERVPNCELTVPFLRFPQWHYCTQCGLLDELPLTTRGKQKCRECETRKKRARYTVQVPFVTMCENGHIGDFPWRQWVHRTASPNCEKPVRLISTGGTTLASQMVKCDCGAERPLAEITVANPDGTTVLSQSLDASKQEFKCPGARPWLGSTDGSACGLHIRASLRSAANVYFGQVRNAIYLPRGGQRVPSELVTLLEQPPFWGTLRLLNDHGLPITAEYLRGMSFQVLQPYRDDEVVGAAKLALGHESGEGSGGGGVPEDDRETAFRREEYNVLRKGRDEDQLKIREAKLADYGPDIPKLFSRIMLVDKLRETRVLAGFSRVFPENGLTPDEQQRLLWRNPPTVNDSWLPAYIVFGEGIYLELNEQRLQKWVAEHEALLTSRVAPIIRQYGDLQAKRRLRQRPLGPRFLLLHTLAHLLMNRLTFECGYSSAALRERLYVSDHPGAPMAGLLIYTAAGDAEGTMGGLVRMGKPEYFEPALRRALEGAQWCSADPVCMEMGDRGGQGPDSCNLAACHNCALVPETACEEFNRFLDRMVVIGSLQQPDLGYFGSLAS